MSPSLNRNLSILNLNFECFEAIFGWLSLKNLNSLAQTCEQLQQITGIYFLNNFNAIEVHCGQDGMLAFNSIRVDGFAEIIQKLFIHDVNLCSFRDIGFKCASLKEIHFVGVTVTIPKVQCLKYVLCQIEILELRDIVMKINFYEQMLKFCNNLNRLIVRNPNMRCGNAWLQQKYPLLERIELFRIENLKFSELVAFFKKNENVRHFSTDVKFLSRFHYLVTETKVHLDDLTIVRDCRDELVNSTIVSHLNYLHKVGFYKRLHFHGAYLLFDGRILQNYIDQIAQLHSLETIRFKTLIYIIPHVSLSALINLKELSMVDPQMGTHIFHIAKDLKKLECITFTHAFLDDIVPFLTYSPKLTKIHLKGDIRTENYIIQLDALNDKRQRLNNACTATIYANDNIFIQTKWAIGRTNFDFIVLNRG